MARFNIESSLFKEQGFQDLLIEVGNRHTAKGIVWELFETAQEYWYPDRKLIPIEVFKAKKLPEQLFAPNGLAELRSDGVYVRGSKDAFQWLFEKSEAGRKSGVARRKKREELEAKPAKIRKLKGNEQNEQMFASVEQTRTNANEPERTGTSLLSSPIPTPTLNSYSLLSSKCAGLSEARTPAEKPTAQTWRAYREAYELRYRVAPTWNATVGGQLANFTRRVPIAEAPMIAAFYIAHNAPKYVSSGHSVGSLLQDSEKLRTEWLTGNRITAHDAKTAEFGDSLKKQMDRLARGDR